MTHENRLETDTEFRDSLSPQTTVICGVCCETERDCECASQGETGVTNDT